METVYDEYNIKARLKNLYSSLNMIPKILAAAAADSTVQVMYDTAEICSIIVEEESYRITGSSAEWRARTSYLCNDTDNDEWFYFVDTIDECIGEVKGLAFVEEMRRKNSEADRRHTSELSKTVSAKAFEKAYSHFIEQADKNVKSGKAEGSTSPYGFADKVECDGAIFKARYGSGSTSSTPYMNWWAVSIYYIPKTQRILLGIENGRYPHLSEMEPLHFETVGRAKMNIAVFYETYKDTVDYEELYESFITLCEKVIELGLD